jgi:hypothetical protein
MTRNPVIRLRGARSNGVSLIVLADVWRYALPDNDSRPQIWAFLFGHGSSRQRFERGWPRRTGRNRVADAWMAFSCTRAFL